MGDRRVMTVKEVKENHFIKPNNQKVHLITFQDPTGGVYVAEETSDLTVSNFKRGLVATFEIISPGKGNNKDWVRWISNDGKQPIPRDNLEVAKTAFSCAVQVGLRENWSEATILDRAASYANKILIIAQSI